MRRVRPLRVLLLACGLLAGSVCAAPDVLTVVSWGGAYERSQTRAYFEPFSAASGIEIRVERYNGGIDELRRQVEADAVRWDLIDLESADNLLACELGLLESIDHDRLSPAPDGTPAVEDFAPGTLTDCGVAQIVSATVLAFNPDAFPGEKPHAIGDLFDLDTFPGRRALQKKPIANLEWALLSYGVPVEDLYSLLSTERGLRLAFARLDSIKDQIVWWVDGAEPARLLAQGEAVMASGYNGRFFDAAQVQHWPIEIIWDGQLYDYSTWGIVKGAPHADAARAFVRFATSTERLAEQARYIAYGPARRSAARRVWRHLDSGIDVRPHLPTYQANARRAIRKDQWWYAKTQRRLSARFAAWAGE